MCQNNTYESCIYEHEFSSSTFLPFIRRSSLSRRPLFPLTKQINNSINRVRKLDNWCVIISTVKYILLYMAPLARITIQVFTLKA